MIDGWRTDWQVKHLQGTKRNPKQDQGFSRYNLATPERASDQALSRDGLLLTAAAALGGYHLNCRTTQ